MQRFSVSAIGPSGLLRVVALFSVVLAASGCSQVYTVKVDAIRTPEVAPRRTYHLVSADAQRDTSDPVYIEAAALVDRALESNGLFAASRPEWADMVVELDFGVGPRRLVSVPDTSARDAAAESVFIPEREAVSVRESQGTYVPTAVLTKIVAKWEKHLSLVARENATGSAGSAELWRVDVSIEDPSPAMDGLLPILAAALVNSIDCDSSPGSIRRISEKAPEAVLVSQSL